MRRSAVVLGATVIAAVSVFWSWYSLGPRSAWFALAVVWLPMTWLGTISHVVAVRVPDRFHELRSWERDGRLWEHLGVRIAKRLLRRGPFSVFNPGLRMPTERSPHALAVLDRKMRDAEASHAILLVATTPVIVHAALRGWWTAAGCTLLFDLLVNGYPVMLQRYNRALLAQRFAVRE